jgi:hypothetical protein
MSYLVGRLNDLDVPASNNLYWEDKYLFCSRLGQYGTNILFLGKIPHSIKNLDIFYCKIIEFWGAGNYQFLKKI